MHYLVPHIIVLIIAHFKQSLPELLQIILDSAWAHLLGGLQPYKWVFHFGELYDFIHILCLLNTAEVMRLLSLGVDHFLLEVFGVRTVLLTVHNLILFEFLVSFLLQLILPSLFLLPFPLQFGLLTHLYMFLLNIIDFIVITYIFK